MENKKSVKQNFLLFYQGLQKKFGKVLVSIFSIFVIGIVTGGLSLGYFLATLPSTEDLLNYKPALISKILSKDGTVLLEIGNEKRDIVAIDDIPPRIIDAFLAAEDDKFYEHNGFDHIGFARALIKNIQAGGFVQGGSTITQQVAKSILLTRERSIARKIRDILLALKIEKKLSKEEILFLYLNQVYLGGGYYGVKSAIRGYFDKSLEEASIAESALIAGLLVAPTKYSPYSNPNFAKIRQEYVLGRMRDTGRITEEEFNQAKAEKMRFQRRVRASYKGGHFTEWVRQRVEELVGKDRLKRDGFTIKTTVNWTLQEQAEKAVLAGVKEIDKRQGFKGPLRRLETEEEWLNFQAEFRKKMSADNSHYFFLNPDKSVEYELSFDQENFLKIQEKQAEVEEKHKRFVIAGNDKEDDILKLLKVDESYEALVTGVDDRQQVIYFSLGGLNGVIPYTGFNWAHERNISEERQYFPYIKKPSRLVKPGDIILVQIKKTHAGLWWRFDKDYRQNFKDQALTRFFQAQRVIVADLDQESEVEASLVAMDPFRGEVVSLVGGKDFSKSQFNRAIQSLRQPGSAFKPLLFAAALENGYSPASMILDSPETLGGVEEGLNWKPRNYDGKFKGLISFRRALQESRNVPTVKIATDIGLDKIFNFVERIELKADIERDLSLALGSFGVTLIDLVSLYAIFPNGGKKVYPKTILSIVDRDGNQYPVDQIDNFRPVPMAEEVQEEETVAKEESEEVILETEKDENIFTKNLSGDQVYDQRLAYLMTNLLRGVIQDGTGRKAKHISQFIGGKTGTTNNYVDAWFLGFSSNLAVGTWAGFDNNKTLGWGETGAKAALPVWRDYLQEALKRLGEQDFRIPEGIINVAIDKTTGKLAGKSRGSDTLMESFVVGMEPGSQTENKKEYNPEESQVLEDDDYYLQ